MFFEIPLQGTKSLTSPAPELFFPSGELPEGRQWGLAAPQMAGGGSEGGEGSPVQDALASPHPPMPDPLSGSCRAGDKLGKINRDSDTHSLGEIILSLNEFKLSEIEAVQASTHRGAGQGSRCFSFKTTSSQAPFSRASHCHFQLFVNTGECWYLIIYRGPQDWK